MQRVKNFLRNTEGAETIEYAIIVGFLVVIATAAYTSGLGDTINTYLAGLLPS